VKSAAWQLEMATQQSVDIVVWYQLINDRGENFQGTSQSYVLLPTSANIDDLRKLILKEQAPILLNTTFSQVIILLLIL
jgi:hypothetical protein